MAKKLTKKKAREILHDKSVHGNPLTDKQRRFFGAIAGGAKPYKAENGIEGTMGGLTDIGFNYNSAWGGAWKNGGNLPMGQNGLIFLEPNSPKLPASGNSSELAMSIGGENGEPAYLIPTMKYGRMQVDPLFEFKRTGEHLGGPFKTWQEADEWEKNVRHPYVEKGQSIPAPYKRWGKDFAMGGTLPGMTGFMYARTQNPAPSEGKYAKKTLPSAQNGQEMKYYQEGLDFKPKTISKNGGWLDKYDEAQDGDLIPKWYSSPSRGDIPVQTGAAEQLRQVGMKKAAPAIEAEKIKRAQAEATKKAKAREVNVQAAQKLTPQEEAERFQATYERNKQIASQNPDEILFNYRTGETARKGDVPAGGDWGTVNIPAIVQSAALTTPSGSNIAAGQIGAETFVNMNPITAPIMAAGRFTQAALGKDPWGFEQSKVLGTLGLIGDIAGLGLYKTLPGSSGARNIPRQIINTADKQFSKVGRSLAQIEREGKSAGLSDWEISNNQLNKVGITSNQRQAYVPLVSDFLERYVYPYGYGGFGNDSKLTQVIKNILGKDKNLSKYSKEGELNSSRNPFREDAWSLYLGKPQKYNTFRIAETAPVNHPAYPQGSLKDMDIYSLNYENELVPNVNNLHTTNPHVVEKYINPLTETITYDVDHMGVMGGYNKRLSSLGFQYNDIWDLEPSVKVPFTYGTKEIKIPIHKLIGKPFMSHGNTPYTWAEHQSNLTKFLDSKIADRLTAQMETGIDFTPQVSRLIRQLEKVKSAIPIKKQGGIIKDNMGYWNPKNWGKPVEIGSNNITMRGVNQPLLGISDAGDVQYMEPGGDYKFKGKKVTEYPVMQKGGELKKLDDLVNFTNYNKKAKNGGWLDKYK